MSFTSIQELKELAINSGKPIYQVMLDSEVELKGLSEEKLIETMAAQFDVMVEAVRLGTSQEILSKTGITGGDGYRVASQAKTGETFVDGPTLAVVANAMAVNEVNAAMGRIVATPTAGSAGILAAVLVYAMDTGKYTKDQLVKALFTASALGLVVANRASISGAAGGCQAEIGSATAMAAGALVELRGGDPQKVSDAVGIALKNSLGLVCDPVAGLVEIPCILRNGLHALTALAAADMALSGVMSVIPADEVVGAMHEIGQQMPESLRETGIGGLAGTPTGKRIANDVFGKKETKQETKQVSAKYQSAYEIIGPVMVGPSSSHTAGAVRIGNVAGQLLKEKPVRVNFALMGSFAKTFQGHGTDRALIAGVLGFTTKDPRVAEAFDEAEAAGLEYSFEERILGSYHPNTVVVELEGETRKVKILASSIGGGKIEVQELDDYGIKFSGERPTLVLRHKDQKGVISAISRHLLDHNVNISRMANERAKINGPAITVCELDAEVTAQNIQDIYDAFPYVEDVALVEVE